MNDERMNLPSASGIHRLVQCPGSWLAEQKYPAEMAGEDAQKGTRIHQYLEDKSIHLNDEELELANSCQILENRILEKWRDSLALEDTALFLKEERLYVRLGIHPIASGKPDKVFVGRDGFSELHFLVVDYKTGNQAPESAESNYQLRTLAVALAGQIEDDYKEYGSISGVIIQPLVTWEPCVVKYEHRHIKETKEELLSNLQVALYGDGSEKKPSASACKYCRARFNCDALKGELAPAGISLPESWLELSPESKADVWRRTKLAKSFIADIEKLVKADLMQGGEIPGLSLKEGKTMRPLEAQKAFEVVNDLMSAAEFTECCKLSLTAFEKAFHISRCRRENNAKLTKKSSKELLDSRIESVVKKTKSEPTVVEGGES